MKNTKVFRKFLIPAHSDDFQFRDEQEAEVFRSRVACLAHDVKIDWRYRIIEGWAGVIALTGFVASIGSMLVQDARDEPEVTILMIIGLVFLVGGAITMLCLQGRKDRAPDYWNQASSFKRSFGTYPHCVSQDKVFRILRKLGKKFEAGAIERYKVAEARYRSNFFFTSVPKMSTICK